MQHNASTQNARAQSITIICDFLQNHGRLDQAFSACRDHHGDTREWVYAVIRNKRLLEHVLKKYIRSKTPPLLKAALLLGAAQILLLDTPPHAAVHETVEAVKQLSGPRSTGLINAVLRNIIRDRDKIETSFESLPPTVRLSHPDPLYNRWRETFNKTRARRLCEWNNQPADTFIRVQDSKADSTAIVEEWVSNGIAVQPHQWAKPFYRIPHGIRPTDLPGFDEGLFTIQDPGTSLAALWLNAQPGETILDACAAPGGKTMNIAEQMQGQGRLLAMDRIPARLTRLEENTRRLGAQHIEILQGDATSWQPDTAAQQPSVFDRILLDVPCSNTGVIRRRPEVRWRFSTTGLTEMTELQAAILENMARYVKPGGLLVYSTCSLEPEENQQQIDRWLTRHPEYTCQRSHLLFPPESHTDGAFVAALVRG
jgi:16S rRNA (cytosine967-C5)-methyltransferase